MKTRRIAAPAIVLFLLAALSATAPSVFAAETTSSYLVSTTPQAGSPAAAATEADGTVISDQDGTTVATLSKQQVAKLRNAGFNVNHNAPFDISSWEQFRLQKELPPIETEPVPAPGTPSPVPEIIPPGVLRVGGPFESTDALSVAIVDSGVTPQPDLNVKPGYSCTKTGDPFGYDDEVGHGTHIAGTYGAREDGSGVVGVVPNIPIIPIRVGSFTEPPSDANIACGLRKVLEIHDQVTPPIKLVNISIGRLFEPDEVIDESMPEDCAKLNDHNELHMLVCQLTRAGVIVVAAAGNDYTDASLIAPAGFPEALTVSAITDTDGASGGHGPDPYPTPPELSNFPNLFKDDTFAFFSNFGKRVDIAAPGVKVLSTQPDQIPLEFDGTSMAAPHAGGVVAWYMSKNPDASAQEIIDVILANAVDPLPYDQPGFVPRQFDKMHSEKLIQGRTVKV